MKPVLDYTNFNSAKITETLRDLVTLESFTPEKTNVDKLGVYIRDRLKNIGASVETVTQPTKGDHYLASWGDSGDQVLILCHFDTVWPEGNATTRPFRVEGGKAVGPGILDMKAGIAITIHALTALSDLGISPKTRVRILFNSDEEEGSPTSRSLIEKEAAKSRHVFCLEPSFGTSGALKTARKGVGIFDIRVTGRAAHAGNDPEHGISAIEELAHQVLRLHKMTDFSSGTTVNVGAITGGSVRNQIADQAEAMIDLRVTNNEIGEHLSERILGLTAVHPQANVLITGGMNRPAMERTANTAHLYNQASNLALDMGMELQETAVGGGSDAQFAAAMNVPVLDGLGGVGEWPHGVDEYIFIDSLPQRTALLASMLANI